MAIPARIRFAGAAAAALLVGASALTLSACATLGGEAAAAASGEVVAMRRLTEAQYKHGIHDLFGPEVKVNGVFEPEVRAEGLLAIGSGAATISTAGFQQYQAMARSIADQVLDEKVRDQHIGCTPADIKAFDETCVRAFVTRVGRVLFRRPLTPAEVQTRLDLARETTASSGDFYVGLKMALRSLLIDPQHLFRVERAKADTGDLQLDAFSRAARVSYLFWNAPPDAELLNAAETGALDTPGGLENQIDRLAASPRLEDGVRAFFDDMLQLDRFATQSKDAAIYPKFSQVVADSAREQTLRTLVELLVARKRDYRDIFTSRETFVNRSIAAIYDVPYLYAKEWMPYTFDAASDRVGILTQTTFLSLFAHPGRSSPTKRGVALHEIFLCEPTPEPPANVDFSIVNDTNQATLKTFRARLLAHASDEACSGCHSFADPPGLVLERFDGLGQHRTLDNGELIDVTAELDGVKLDGSQGLADWMHDNPAVTDCLVQHLYSYGRGKEIGETDRAPLQTLAQGFAVDGYVIPAFMKRLALNPDFYRAERPTPTKDAEIAARFETRRPVL